MTAAALRREPHGEGLQIAALQSPVAARRELGARLDGDDARREARVGAGLRPDRDALADRKGRQPLLRNLDAQVRRVDLERHDRIAGRDELSLPVVTGQDGPGRRRHQGSFALEAPDLSDPRAQGLRSGVQVPFRGFVGADARRRLFALVLQRLQVRRRRDALGHQARDPPLLARDLRQLCLQLCDLLQPGLFLGRHLIALALEVRSVFREPGSSSRSRPRRP